MYLWFLLFFFPLMACKQRGFVLLLSGCHDTLVWPPSFVSNPTSPGGSMTGVPVIAPQSTAMPTPFLPALLHRGLLKPKSPSRVSDPPWVAIPCCVLDGEFTALKKPAWAPDKGHQSVLLLKKKITKPLWNYLPFLVLLQCSCTNNFRLNKHICIQIAPNIFWWFSWPEIELQFEANEWFPLKFILLGNWCSDGYFPGNSKADMEASALNFKQPPVNINLSSRSL